MTTGRFWYVALAAWLLGCGSESESETTHLQQGCAVPDSGVVDPCCKPCPTEIGEPCEDSLRDFPSYARALREFKSNCGGANIASGQCSGGVRTLFLGNGFVTDKRYFDASGNFLGLERTSDLADPKCPGGHYFPERIQCLEPTSKLICTGSLLQSGT